MTTSVSICSNALLELGVSGIADFGEGNDRARVCGALYPNLRNEVLRSHTWKSAVSRVQLSPMTDAPDYGFTKRYLLPSDWVRTMKVGGEGDWAVDFRQEGRYLLSNATPLFLRYVRRNENEGEWDDLLVSIMQMRVKWAICYAITKSTSLRDTLRQEYQQALMIAKSIDSMGAPTDQVAEQSPLIDARF
jgi:hypothetical protein